MASRLEVLFCYILKLIVTLEANRFGAAALVLLTVSALAGFALYVTLKLSL
jgi:hypothetical protein